MKLGLRLLSLTVLLAFPVFAAEQPSLEADIAVVAAAVRPGDGQAQVIEFLRSPGTNHTTVSFIAQNAMNGLHGNSKIRLPLARCWKRLAVDRTIKKDFRVYGFNQLSGLAGRDSSVAGIAKEAAQDIAANETGTFKQKAEAYLQKK